MKAIIDQIEKEIHLAGKEIAKMEAEMQRLDGKIEEHKDRKAMLVDMLRLAKEEARKSEERNGDR